MSNAGGIGIIAAANAPYEYVKEEIRKTKEMTDRIDELEPVVPGDVLRLETELVKIKGPVGIGKAIAYLGEQVCTEAELTFVIQ